MKATKEDIRYIFDCEVERVSLKKHNHADFEKAVVFEQAIRLIDDELTLSNGRQTLDKTDFNEMQDDLFTGRCDSGMCFV